MIEGFDIIMYGFCNWHATLSGPQQTAIRLAPKNRVLYVDLPRSFLSRYMKRDVHATGKWNGPRVQEVSPNLFVYHPRSNLLPVGGLPLPIAKVALKYNERTIASRVLGVANDLGLKDVILWSMSPLHGLAAEDFRHVITVYDAPDMWRAYLGRRRDRAIVKWLEDRLLRKADVVLLGTDPAKAFYRESGIDRDMHVVLQGADVSHFMKATLKETLIPPDIGRIRKPVVGSVGVMDGARFDVELIRYLAMRKPDWSIVLVGPARNDLDLSPLKGLENVHLLGNRPVSALPNYLKGMDVTIIPYMVNETTRYLYPMKMAEYLAAGRPTVVPALPALVPFGGVVPVAESHEDFVAKIAHALEHDTLDAAKAREALARENSWEHRVEEKTACIMRVLKDKSGWEGRARP